MSRQRLDAALAPSVSFTNSLKKPQMKRYGYPLAEIRDYEEDHLVPLSLAGAPQDPANLWPQPLRRSIGSWRIGSTSALRRARPRCTRLLTRLASLRRIVDSGPLRIAIGLTRFGRSCTSIGSSVLVMPMTFERRYKRDKANFDYSEVIPFRARVQLTERSAFVREHALRVLALLFVLHDHRFVVQGNTNCLAALGFVRVNPCRAALHVDVGPFQRTATA